MRVLFVSSWPTHYFPMVPLAWALRSQGHEVRVAVPPAHADTVARSGQLAVPVGDDVDITELFKRDVQPLLGNDDPEVRRRRTLAAIGIFVAVAEAMSGDTVAFARDWAPDLVVHEPTAFTGPLVATLLGVPSVRHLWGPDGTNAGPARGGPIDVPALRRLAGRYGLDDIDPTGDYSADPCPPSMQARVELERIPMSYVPYNGASPVPPDLLAPPRRTRVCVTWGVSTAALAGPEAFLAPRVVGALAELDAEIVVTVNAATRELIGEPGGNVRVVESVPLHLLLPGCAALVHQGGGGSMLTAVATGVPQLVIPQLPDQRFSAAQLAATGAGRRLPGEHADPGAIRAAVTALLEEPGHREAARRLAQENGGRPSPLQVARRLEEISSRAVAGRRSMAMPADRGGTQ
ncbi:nucleotide disphospho-sugar-binding domain-containing protein [Sphaerisporangium fuscum]|uniref:nucleotide disphospho-sugar-binding domain-containing protein n=1 Tax=Sphaerisporangium fuscum TaxID=2835868 RepID=UPI001BDD52B6|nr:nucleotide disphospho-sugar-binding domain-containing protein [Sphaerisporangium fuscum]